MTYVYNEYVQPNFSSIFLKPSQSFCISQYSQETPMPEPSLFINSLQLQAIPIEKGAPALAFS